MIILTILGLKAILNGKSNMDIDHRISTMGYLHTLIGTRVALILASNRYYILLDFMRYKSETYNETLNF